MNKRSVMSRISGEFDDYLNKLSRDTGKPKVQVSRDIAKDLNPCIADRFSFRRRRKGNVAINVAMCIIILFVFGIVNIYWGSLQDELTSDILAEEDFSPEAQTALTTVNDSYPALFDNLFVFLFGGFWLMMLVTSFFIDTHPIFFVVSFIVMIAIVVAGAFISNAFVEVVSDPDVLSMSDQFTKTNFIMAHLVEICIIIGLSEAVVLYAKWRDL